MGMRLCVICPCWDTHFSGSCLLSDIPVRWIKKTKEFSLSPRTRGSTLPAPILVTVTEFKVDTTFSHIWRERNNTKFAQSSSTQHCMQLRHIDVVASYFFLASIRLVEPKGKRT